MPRRGIHWEGVPSLQSVHNFNLVLNSLSTTPCCCTGYAHLTAMLRTLANGKIVVALEGGYNLQSISRSMEAVVKVLLGDPVPRFRAPPDTAVSTLCAAYLHYDCRWFMLALSSTSCCTPRASTCSSLYSPVVPVLAGWRTERVASSEAIRSGVNPGDDAVGCTLLVIHTTATAGNRNHCTGSQCCGDRITVPFVSHDE